jgi:membrane associated rhomboid family serine protease
MATCYRHTDRETGVSCSSCGRPICPDCMTTTPVGMRCPECSRQRTKVRTAGSIGGGDPMLTYVLIGINVLMFLGSRSGGRAYQDLVLSGLPVADGEVWRLVTGGFLHAGFLHIAFNMYLLYILGGMLEPTLGKLRFGAIYFTSLLTGALGAILLTDPTRGTVGASGAVFGLMGAGVVILRARGIDPMQSGLLPTILLNLAITFFPGLNISIGGHVGGLVGGLLTGWIVTQASNRRVSPLLPVAACVVIALVAVGAAFAAATAQVDALIV